MSNPKFLDTTGLNQLWGKIKSALGNKIDKNVGSQYAGKVLMVGPSGVVSPVQASSFGTISFTIEPSDWTLDNNVYVASYSSNKITNTSVEWLIYDSSIETNAPAGISSEKTVAGAMGFTTSVLPTGNISGTIFSIDASAGGLAAYENFGLPVCSSSDNGKTIYVTNGAYALANPVTELPAVTSTDNGKSLIVFNGEWTSGRPFNFEAITIPANAWSNNVATVSVSGVTASNDIQVGIGGSITAEQYEALIKAQMVCTAQGAGTITLTAFGEQPSIALPTTVIIYS